MQSVLVEKAEKTMLNLINLRCQLFTVLYTVVHFLATKKSLLIKWKKWATEKYSYKYAVFSD